MLLDNALQPRDYQIAIASSACESNTLIILPTGLGKTVISVLIANFRLGRYNDGRILMMSPTRPLTLQHYNSFRRFLRIPLDQFEVLTGALKPKDRIRVWRDSKVIFATPQTVLNDIKAGRTALREFVLAVFDEAHRCVKDYSYNEIAKFYMNQAEHPLILGLTASPGGSKEKVEEITRNMFISKIEARSEDDKDVRPYVEQTKVEWVKVRLPDEFKDIRGKLKTLFMEKVEKLRVVGLLPKDKISKKMILDSRASIMSRLSGKDSNNHSKGYLYGSLMNQAQAIMILHALEMIETQGVSPLIRYLCRLRENPEQGKSVRALLRDERWLLIEGHAKRLQLSFEHPKLKKLQSIVREQLESNPESRIIVFTQYRDTIDVILPNLSKHGFQAVKFIGQSNRMEGKGMDQKAQSQILEKFKNHIYNILVSSSIGEEGLHIPDVDLVIFYDAVPSEIRAIQRRGRTGRTMPGRVVILLAEDTIDEQYHYSSIYKEMRMKKIVSKASSSNSEKSTLLDFIH